MNGPKESRGFSYFSALGIHTPWPHPSDRVLSRFSHEAFSVEVVITGKRRIHARVSSFSGVIAEKETPTIEIFGEGIAPFVFGLSYDAITRSISLFLNGTLTDEYHHPIRLYCQENPALRTPKQIIIDIEGINKSLIEREKTSLAYKDTKNLLIRKSSDLERECRLLLSAANMMRGGNLDYIVSASIHLRKIIGPGRGNHVLQDVAALKRASILIWVENRLEKDWLSIFSESDIRATWKSSFSITPRAIYSRQTDLDAWLREPSQIINGKRLTNADLLLGISDKIGAHLDDKRDIVSTLEQIQAPDGLLISSYLIEMSELTIELKNRLLLG